MCPHEETNESRSVLQGHVEEELPVTMQSSPLPLSNLFTKPTSWLGFLGKQSLGQEFDTGFSGCTQQAGVKGRLEQRALMCR